MAAEVKDVEEAQCTADAALREAHLRMASVVDYDVSPGGEDDAATLRTVGEIPPTTSRSATTSRSERRSARIEMDRSAKVSGIRFYFLTGLGALLEYASASWRSAGPWPPASPRRRPGAGQAQAMECAGFLGSRADVIYRVERDDLYLVGTSEVPLAGMHMNEVLDLEADPRRYAGWSSCFRREAGSTARTPAASSGCTGSTGSRCSATGLPLVAVHGPSGPPGRTQTP